MQMQMQSLFLFDVIWEPWNVMQLISSIVPLSHAKYQQTDNESTVN